MIVLGSCSRAEKPVVHEGHHDINRSRDIATVSKNLKKRIQDLDEDAETSLITTLLRLARILRRILET